MNCVLLPFKRDLMNGIISLLSKVYHSKHVWFQELTHKSFYCLYKSKVNFHYSCSVFFPSFLLYGSFIAHYNAMPMEIRWRHSVETYTALRIIRKKNKPIFFLFWRHFVPLSRKHVIQSQQDARKINASIIQKRCENNGPNAKKRHQAKEKSDWIDWRSWSMEHGAWSCVFAFVFGLSRRKTFEMKYIERLKHK